MKKRLYILTTGIILITIALVARLLYILSIGDIASMAQQVQTMQVPLYQNRGLFFDRAMRPLTLCRDASVAVVFPALIKDKQQAALQLGVMTGAHISTSQLMGGAKIFPIAKDSSLIEPGSALVGMKIFDSTRRYSTASVAPHLIGYLNGEGKGVFGLEKRYEDVLKRQSAASAHIIVDATRMLPVDRPVLYENVNEPGSHVLLTIDGSVQQVASSAMEKRGYKGAVVVTDAVSGDILALVSTPSFDQNNIASYAQSTEGELTCRYEQAYEPGSVFKIIMCAAAIESGLENMEFHCTGQEDTDGIVVACHKKEGHGTQTLMQAFANSCNPAFIQLGKALGASKIADMAYAMGFGGEKTAYAGEKVQEGNIPYLHMNPAAVANMSIGQGNVQVTPLQMAGVLDVLASGGVKRPLNVVAGICNDNGQMMESTRRSGDARVLSRQTVIKVLSYMCGAVEHGTASAGRLPGVAVAAKTGTAQSGWQDTTGRPMIHGWYAGIVPAWAPKYTITVFVENGREGGTSAGQVFREIVKYLYDIEG